MDIDEFQWAKPDCDIYIRIEDSGAYHIPGEYRPLIYWAGDTHIRDGVPRKQIARDADFTFVAQKNAVGEIGDEWLPHAAHYVRNGDKRPYFLSAAMVLNAANPIFAERTRIAMQLPERYKRFGSVIVRPGIYHKEMANLYAQSLVVWHHSVGGDLAMRHFEGAACGAAVVCSRVLHNGMEETFGDLVVQYEDEPHLHYILNRAGTDPAARERMRERGRALQTLVKEKHMYKHRLERLVEKAEELTR